MGKKPGALLTATVLAVAGWCGPAAAQTAPAPAPPTTAPPRAAAELLVDLDTGRALVEQNDHTPLPPGSLTKMLTGMIAADWIGAGDPVPVSAVAANAYPDKVGMKAGQVWTFDSALHSLIIDSANDAAYALAEKVGTSLAGFASTMQAAATQIGMADHPVLEDPAGLDGREGFDGGNRISAWDLAIAGRDMMANPTLAGIAATKRFNFTGPDGIVYSIRNQNIYFLRLYAGAIGVKTGLTNAAGFCVVEEAVRGGRHMLSVVLHGQNSYTTAADLLDQGFATPVGAEPIAAPTLPPVAEPMPPPGAGDGKAGDAMARDGRSPAGGGKSAPIAAVGTRSDGGGTAAAWPEAAAAAVMLLGIGVTGNRVRLSRRRRPGA